LIRFVRKTAVYCAAKPLLLSRSVDAGLCPRQLRQDLIVGVVRKRSAHAQSVLGGSIQCTSILADNRMIAAMTRRIKPIAAKV